MESGFLNRKKSSSSSGLASKVNDIDGKVLVNAEKPLKSILKRTGLVGKTGSFSLPRDFYSDVKLPSNENTITTSRSTLNEEVNNTLSSPPAVGVSFVDDGNVVGLTGTDVARSIPKAQPTRYDDGCFVDVTTLKLQLTN